MADVLDWRHRSRQKTILQQVIGALSAGRLVAFPYAGGYCLAANVLAPAALTRLAQRPTVAVASLTLALASSGQALDWVPDMSLLGRRLMRRCWPGPVVLQCSGIDGGLASRLPEAARQQLCPEGLLALHVPADDALAHTLANVPFPLALAAVQWPKTASELTADSLQQHLGAEAALILDVGPRPLEPACTWVRINGATWTLLRAGAVSADEVTRQTGCVILFICTGNTCRSPMAAALCRKLLAERLGCSPQELPQRGYQVLSAGLAAMPGDPATPEAVQAVQELGADLTNHVSQPLTADLLALADHVLTMTQGHLLAVAGRFARLSLQPRLLDPAGQDIRDPVGADQEVYRQCAQQILHHLEKFLSELPLP